MMAAKKKAGGRKPLWDKIDMSDRLDSVRGWALNGSTDAEIMEMLGISHETFYRWKKEKSEFSEALKKGRHESNGELLNSLFRQTTGYYQKVTEPMKVRDEMGAEHIEMVTYDKYFPAVPSIGIFLSKNRLGLTDKVDQNINMQQVIISDNIPASDDE
jgi:hypothetical protein